jgi:hypothetical protein
MRTLFVDTAHWIALLNPQGRASVRCSAATDPARRLYLERTLWSRLGVELLVHLPPRRLPQRRL